MDITTIITVIKTTPIEITKTETKTIKDNNPTETPTPTTYQATITEMVNQITDGRITSRAGRTSTNSVKICRISSTQWECPYLFKTDLRHPRCCKAPPSKFKVQEVSTEMEEEETTVIEGIINEAEMDPEPGFPTITTAMVTKDVIIRAKDREEIPMDKVEDGVMEITVITTEMDEETTAEDQLPTILPIST